jgi:hypothetical protein
VAEKTSVLGSNPADVINIFWISEWTQMSISEPDIGMTVFSPTYFLPISE